MKVLSLFDGLSGAQAALKKLGVMPEYYASEIDEYAIRITQKNFPNTIQLGDINEIDRQFLPEFDLLIGGSPCQDLSIANNRGSGLQGPKSSLFWKFVEFLDDLQPRYFVLENVASMKTKDFVIITNALGVEPIMLDAGLVSAQRRKRYFWTNIPGIKQPVDQGLVIADILDPDAQRDVVKIDPARLIKTSYGVRWNGHQKTSNLSLQGCQAQNIGEKAPSLNINIGRTPTRIVGGSGQSTKAVAVDQKGFVIDTGLGRKYPYRIVRQNSLRTQPQGRSAQSVMQKDFCVTPGCVSKNHALIIADQNHQQDRAFDTNRKHGTLAATRTSSKTNIRFEDVRIEKLTWNEIERLAGLPVGYTDLGEGNNKTEHRGRAIGNGFQIDIVAHLLSFMLGSLEPIKRSKRNLLGEQLTFFNL